MLAFAWASHFKVLCLKFFYVLGKALSGKLSCMGTDLVIMIYYWEFLSKRAISSEKINIR